MLIYPSANDIKAIHEHLIEIYQEEEFPIKIQEGFIYEGAINTVATRAVSPLYGKIYFPHTLHKAAYYLHSLIVYHAFVDGNKRTALLTTLFFLRWNGYNLIFPQGTAYFLRNIATPSKNIGLKDTYNWILQNTKRSIFDILRGKFLVTLYSGIDPKIYSFVRTMLELYAFENLPQLLIDIFKREASS